MATEAQIRASAKHNKKKDSITIRPDKETGAMIRQSAEERGMSVTEFILNAVNEYIKNK